MAERSMPRVKRMCDGKVPVVLGGRATCGSADDPRSEAKDAVRAVGDPGKAGPSVDGARPAAEPGPRQRG